MQVVVVEILILVEQMDKVELEEAEMQIIQVEVDNLQQLIQVEAEAAEAAAQTLQVQVGQE